MPRMNFEKSLPSRENFIWVTNEGQDLLLSEMYTDHIYKALKMLYNHLAKVYDAPCYEFHNFYRNIADEAKYRPEQVAMQILVFMREIEIRKNLDVKYIPTYLLIKEQVVGRQKLFEPITKLLN